MLKNKRMKVFCIGFNKTGTSSLHEFFTLNGLASIHNTTWPEYSHINNGKPYFLKNQCFSDGENSSFATLRAWFPNSLFVLNTRSELPWLRSRVKHVLRYNEDINLDALIEHPNYGDMAKEFFFDPRSALFKWINHKRIYEAQARKYFSKNKNFIELDVTTSDRWERDLGSLMFAHGLLKKRYFDSRPAANQRGPAAIKNEGLLKYYFDLIDEVRQSCHSGPRDAA